MLRSMTAFGRGETTAPWGRLSLELRSVNHRYLELAVRLPEELRAIEPQLRERVAGKLKRGKLDCSLRLHLDRSQAGEIELDDATVKSVIDACHRIEGRLMNAARLSPIELLRWPGVVREAELDVQPLATAAMALLDQVLDDLVATREREGERIGAMLAERCAGIAKVVEEVRQLRPEVNQRLREKLLARLAELQAEPDQQRLEQELVYLAQKLDVEEELDRLQAHLQEIGAVLGRAEPVGRRLDFLMQELNRETNTLGSKSGDAETTRASVELKVLIEQMREQIQNLE